MAVVLEPRWGREQDELSHGSKLELPIRNAFNLVELGLADFGCDFDRVLAASLFTGPAPEKDAELDVAEDRYQRLIVGRAHDEHGFSLFHLDYPHGADSHSIEFFGSVAIHEATHCLRFTYSLGTDAHPDEPKATEILAYGAELAFRELYFGQARTDDMYCPDTLAAERVKEKLQNGLSLETLVHLPADEVMAL